MLHKKTVQVKTLHFYVKKAGLQIERLNTAFLQKYIFVKMLLVYEKSLLFYKNKVVKNQLFHRNIFL